MTLATCATSAVSTGGSRSTFRPMSSSVTGRTWFRVSLGACPPVLDPPLLIVRDRRLLKLSDRDLEAKEGNRKADSEAGRA